MFWFCVPLFHVDVVHKVVVIHGVLFVCFISLRVDTWSEEGDILTGKRRSPPVDGCGALVSRHPSEYWIQRVRHLLSTLPRGASKFSWAGCISNCYRTHSSCYSSICSSTGNLLSFLSIYLSDKLTFFLKLCDFLSRNLSIMINHVYSPVTYSIWMHYLICILL